MNVSDDLVEILFARMATDQAKEDFEAAGDTYDWQFRAKELVTFVIPKLRTISKYLIENPDKWNPQFIDPSDKYYQAFVKEAPNQFLSWTVSEHVAPINLIPNPAGKNRTPDFLWTAFDYASLPRYTATPQKKKKSKPSDDIQPLLFELDNFSDSDEDYDLAKSARRAIEDVVTPLYGKPYIIGQNNGVANVLDGAEIKTNKDTITINAHARNVGLHWALIYTFDEEHNMSIPKTFVTFALTSDYKRCAENSEKSTVKYVLNPDIFYCLETGFEYRTELKRYYVKGFKGPTSEPLFV